VLVCMFYAARYAAGPTRVPAQFLPYMYVSSACYGLVGTVLFGMSYVVIQDRESVRMLKYIYISPARFQAYFLGRGLARGLVGVCLPTTYWLEGMRRALTGDLGVASPLAGWSNWELLGLLAASTVVLTVAAQAYYRHAVRRAWRLGKLEETSGV